MTQNLDKTIAALSMGALLLCAIPAAAAKPFCGDGKCSRGEDLQTCPADCEGSLDVPVCANLSDFPEARIRNVGLAPYCDSEEDGIWAFFQHEEGPTSDLWVNLVSSNRVFLIDFSGFVPTALSEPDCIPSDWIDGSRSTTGWRIFVDEVDNVPVADPKKPFRNTNWDDFCGRYGPEELCDLDLASGWPYVRRRAWFFLDDDVNKVSFQLYFQTKDWDFDVNVFYETSYLKVYHPNPDLWVIKPELNSSNEAVAALLRIGKGRHNETNCGYFSMPFELEVWPVPAD